MKISFAVFLAVFLVLALNTGFVLAKENFNETKQLIDSNISCSKLTDAQLEAMGDYYMEQMHSGEAHELMHTMMGGEDSAAVKQMHIQMAKSIYCGETSQGMMSMMSMMAGNNMMGGGMMGNSFNMMSGNIGGNMMGYGMMSGSYAWYWNFLNALYVISLIGLIVLVYSWIIKLWKNNAKHKGGKK
ncbi:hypothetical protein HYU07_01450 [Candidatus Woesearchaeota archaeon]|nr:hypothetical protein [Candidatus Woesearchaeota archaeon]